MKCKGQIRVFVSFCAGLLALCTAKQAYALFPALDTSSLVQGIEQTMTAIKESTVVVNTMETVKKTSAAIGTAKATVTEYVVNAKKEIEEVANQVKEYKEQVEEYAEEVKEYKEKVEEGIEKGKEIYEQGKNIVENADDIATGALEGVKSKVEDKTGISLDKNDTQADVKTDEQEAQEPVEEATATSTRKAFSSEGEPVTEIEETQTAEVDVVAPQAVAQEVIDNATLEAIKVSEEQKTIEKEETIKLKTKLPEEISDNNVGQPAEEATATSTRKAFTTSSLHHEESMSFAFAITGLRDNGTNINGTVVIPKMLALTCDLTSETALDKGKMDKCFSFLNDNRNKSAAEDKVNAPEVFNDALINYAALNIAEAMKILQDSEDFEKNYVEPVEFAPDSNAQDTYSNIIEMNKGIDMQMNTLLSALSTNVISEVITNYQSDGYTSNKEFSPVYANALASDTGTGPDGVMLLPKSMAKACGIGSKEATDQQAIEECFNTLAGIKGDATFVMLKNEIMRELNQNAIETALRIKSDAGDYKDKQKEALNNSGGIQDLSAAAGGIIGGGDGTDISESQNDNIKLSTMSAQNLIKIIDLYSAKQNLSIMSNFYGQDVGARRAEAKAKQMLEDSM